MRAKIDGVLAELDEFDRKVLEHEGDFEDGERAEQIAQTEDAKVLETANRIWEGDEAAASNRLSGIGSFLILVEMTTRNQRRSESFSLSNSLAGWTALFSGVFFLGMVSLWAVTMKVGQISKISGGGEIVRFLDENR